MGDKPKGARVTCPACDKMTIAVVPPQSRIIKQEEEADRKVWVDCHNCGERFLVHCQID